MGFETEFTPFTSLLGGMLIGIAALVLMATDGRIAGISGIAGGLLSFKTPDRGWRLSFVAGLIVAPLVWLVASGGWPDFTLTVPWPLIALAGVLVGLGTQLGSGCTSGHGVCGMSRLSKRSITATLVFMTTGMITVFILRNLGG